MAFSNLATNQMVSEADAATGGFPLQSGQSHGSSNQCMSKDAANVKYILDQSLLTSYSGNQLIPKSAWATGVIPINYVPLAYEGRNTLGAQYDGQTFNYCRINTNTFADNFVMGQAHTSIPANFDYLLLRGYMGFDGNLVPTITSGGIKLNLASAADNTLQDPTKFVMVRTRIPIAYNHVWNSSDYTLCVNSVDEKGTGTLTEIVTINPGQLGDILFPFNTDGLNFVNSNVDLTFILMEYDHDWEKITPTVQYSSNKWIRSASNQTKLYYQSTGGGAAGTGTCKCVFNGSAYVFQFTLNTGINGSAVTTNGYCTVNQGGNSTSGIESFSGTGTPLMASFKSFATFNNGSSAIMAEVSITLSFNSGAEVKTFKSNADITFTTSEITAGTAKNIVYDQIT